MMIWFLTKRVERGGHAWEKRGEIYQFPFPRKFPQQTGLLADAQATTSPLKVKYGLTKHLVQSALLTFSSEYSRRQVG